MKNFQLKYELLVVFDKIILCFLSAVFLVIYDKIILHFFSAKIIIFMLGQKVLKFEFAIEAIILFIKSIKSVHFIG